MASVKNIKLIGLIILSISLIFSGTIFAQNQTNSRIISVTGDAVVTAAPDIAFISLGVETRERTADTASQKNSDAVANIINSLKEFGLKDNEITTSSYYIYSYQEMDRTSDTNETYTVYNVRNQINISTKDLDNVGSIIDIAISAGANQVQGISFDLENKQELKLQALQEATKQAHAKAKAIADAIGIDVLEISSITENADFYAPYTEAVMFRASAADNRETPINPGDVEIKASVVSEYRF